MANENTGTTDGGQPQKDATNPDGTKRKIAGKFDTIEEAVEKGYTGLETKMHEISGTVSKLVKVLESALASPGPTPIGSHGSDDGYNRGGTVNEDDIDPVEFLKHPNAVLMKREVKLAERISGQVVDLVGNMMAVSNFKSQNPDLTKHEKLVQAFVRDEDPRLPTAERLQNAGARTREYLKTLKVDLNADLPNRAPAGEHYNEGPTGFAPNRPSAPVAEEGEAELVNYINERNRNMAEHFGKVEK